MINKIKIPWYNRRVPGVKPLDDIIPGGYFEFDSDKKKRRKKNRKPDKPSPKPQLERQPSKVPSRVPSTSKVTDFSLETTVPLHIPRGVGRVLPNGKWFKNPLPDAHSKQKPAPSIIKGKTLTGKKPKGVVPAISAPGGEILFKLLEGDPTGKYDKFLKSYNDLTLEILWNTMNPYIVFDEPSYSEIQKFLNSHDMSKTDSKDVIKYFKKQGVSGKDLTTLPVRIYTFNKLVETMNNLEDIVVPPIKNEKDKIY